jgi:hypothetical protein
MECGEKRRLLRLYLESNQEYREALQRCKVCRSCVAEAPEERTSCQLDTFLAKSDEAHAAALGHLDAHNC